MESTKLSFELIPWASPSHRNSIFRSNLLQKHQMVDLHVMVVVVNCDLVCAEEIAWKVLKTNQAGETLLGITYWMPWEDLIQKNQ